MLLTQINKPGRMLGSPSVSPGLVGLPSQVPGCGGLCLLVLLLQLVLQLATPVFRL